MSVNVIDRLHSVDVCKYEYRPLVLLLPGGDVIIEDLFAAHAVIHAGKGVRHVDLVKLHILALGENVTAHAEELGVNVLYKEIEIEIKKKLGRILYGDVSDYEIQIVHRGKYIEI